MAEYVSYPRQSGKNMLREALNALVAIQKLHKPCKTFSGKEVCNVCNTETGKPVTYPCKTRKLADEGLDRMARTNQGENK